MLRALRIGAWTGLGAALAGTVVHFSAAPALGWYILNGVLGLVASVSFAHAYKKADRKQLAWALVAVYVVGLAASRATQALLQADEVTQGLVAMAAYGGAIHFLVSPALAFLWFLPWDRHGWTGFLAIATLTACAGAVSWWMAFRRYPVGSPEWLARIETTEIVGGASYSVIAIVALAGVYNVHRNWPMALATLTKDQPSAEPREPGPLDSANHSTADCHHEPPTTHNEPTAEPIRPPAVIQHPFDTATDQGGRLNGTIEAQAASDAEVKRALTSRLARGEISEATFTLALASLSEKRE